MNPRVRLPKYRSDSKYSSDQIMQSNKKMLIIPVAAVLMSILLGGCFSKQAKESEPAVADQTNQNSGQNADQEQVPSFRVEDPLPEDTAQLLVKSYNHPALGNILADSKDMTLYIFTKDSEGISACYDDCAAKWPPLLVSGEIKAESGLAGELGTIDRTDGTKQATYQGKPLYYYFEDTVSGDASGEGVGGAWFAVKLGQTAEQTTTDSAAPKMVQ